ncbi:helix-turn-helix domain-containing protein [Pedobacter jamesrossensis]|uniref:Helix-turn-helix domain-containing protein n=1 Tax=Pedobacter jamesrossensis TaxID=1908238 RepID=A0ABV8NM14_9SPHI
MKLDLITTEDLEIFKEVLLAEIKGILKHHTTPNEKSEWLRSAEVRKLLNISQGTLQNLRVNGTLRYSMIGKIPYYKREDILNVLENNLLKH